MKYVLTFDNDDLNACYGVFNTLIDATAEVMRDIIENDENEFKVKVEYDEGYDAWIDLLVTIHREGEGYNFDFTTRYRIFKLKEEGDEKQ